MSNIGQGNDGLARTSGGSVVSTYTPAMMQFDGSSGYYNKTYTSSGNKITVVIRFNRASFTGGGIERLFYIRGSTYPRAGAIMYASDHADTDKAGCILVQTKNSSNVNICLLMSPTGYMDGTDHTLFYSFDGDTGSATFIIDGVDADDTGNASRVAPTTGTLETGAASVAYFTSEGANFYSGQAGFIGCRDAYLTNWQDFMSNDGSPRNIESTLSTVWGGTPLFWNPTGYMEDNKGSAGNMQRNGNVVVVDNDQTPLIPTYTPAMMKFNGSTGYYSKSYTSSGNLVTTLIRFTRASFTGGAAECLYAAYGPTGSTNYRTVIKCYASDHATSTVRSKLNVEVRNSSGTVICNLWTNSGYIDGTQHTLMFSFNGTAGTAIFKIDGADAEDAAHSLRVAPTTGTLNSGASSTLIVGQLSGSSPSQYFSENIGFVGHADSYLTNVSDFMDSSGNPKALDETTWTEWGAQPLFWNEHGEMTNNLGSAGAMTKNGTIVIGKGGN